MKSSFPTTQWGVVLTAANRKDPDFRGALENLCQHYWYPVYAHARFLGNDRDAAEDLTQGFFAHVLETNGLRVADPDRGRFRAFLKASFDHFTANEQRFSRAQKRGGGKPLLGLDFSTAESTYRYHEPADDTTPETSFERHWARMLLTRALERLEKEAQASPEPERFRRLEPFLTGRPDGIAYKQIGDELGMTESAIKVAVHRLRRRYGRLLRDEVAQTVNSPEHVDDELHYVFSVLEG